MHLLYPHQIRGEGHFCAVLQKGSQDEGTGEARKTQFKGALTPETLAAFLKKKKIHVLRAGVEPGETKQDRKGKSYYTPSHAEAMAKDWETDTGSKLGICSLDLAMKYLHGEVIDLSRQEDSDYVLCGGEGWMTVYFDRYPLGLGKRTGSVIKNHYPKGLRHL